MTYVDRVVEELGVLAESYEWVAENGAHRGEKVRKPGRATAAAPVDLDVLDWLAQVEEAVGEWCGETDRVLGVAPLVGSVPERLRDLTGRKLRVVTVKMGTTPTWVTDVYRLSRTGREMSGRSHRFVRVFERCPTCGVGELVADPNRWVLVCLDSSCRDDAGRKTTFAIDMPVGVAGLVRHHV